MAQYAGLYGRVASDFAKELPDIEQGIAQGFARLARSPSIDVANQLTEQLNGAIASVDGLRRALVREAGGSLANEQ
jgi:hypothetical protein